MAGPTLDELLVHCRAQMWAFVVLLPCLRVFQQWSEGVLAPSPTTRIPVFFCPNSNREPFVSQPSLLNILLLILQIITVCDTILCCTKRHFDAWGAPQTATSVDAKVRGEADLRLISAAAPFSSSSGGGGTQTGFQQHMRIKPDILGFSYNHVCGRNTRYYKQNMTFANPNQVFCVPNFSAPPSKHWTGKRCRIKHNAST